MSASEIDVPTAFIQLCKGLNAYSFLASDAMSGVVREAVKYIDINDRDMVRAFIDEILIETTSDVKLQNLIRECGA